jgi:hypothetical protein
MIKATIICNCVGKHIPKPMQNHEHFYWPKGEGGPDETWNKITLCPTTHANVHELWDAYDLHDGRPPWNILKNYSEYCRDIVEWGRELRRTRTRNAASSATITTAI